MPADTRRIPPDLGISVSSLTDATRARFGVQLAQKGVLVTGVAAGTDAAERGLTAGDVILRVQERTVTEASEVQQGLRRRPRRKAQLRPGADPDEATGETRARMADAKGGQ